MPRYKITIEYLGKGLIGWQKQNSENQESSLISVQSILQDAFYKLTQEKPELIVAGRTDAGVNAFGQVVHFDLEKNFKAFNIQEGLNVYLMNSPVSVKKAEIVSDDFNARFSANKRHYRYIILNQRTPSILMKDRAWHIKKPLDIEAMRQASEYLIGRHDFSSFRSTQCQAKNPVRKIEEIRISQSSQMPIWANKIEDKNFCEQFSDNLIFIDISAKSFLHHQVRNIVGTLKDIGFKKYPPEKMQEILEAKDRTKAGETAPACGLYFVGVEY
ncbi:MAG: tRNA pseudouridine(38-40) synthase TruA [Rickettsiales bacterium]|nr:tRNA pseudouridine(38-40) synthase TruA [Rickettsiales bacterium]